MSQAYAALKRNQQLRKYGTIPEALLEESQAAAGVAQASFDSAKEGIVGANAQLTLVIAQRKIAALNLSRATIKAPVGGIVSEHSAKLGEIAMSGSEPLLTIIARGEVELEAKCHRNSFANNQDGRQSGG